ncbi:DUF4355 domain-containing protein [Mammaliicoccus sciuri]|uniref:DUF4355 domain-containing protein n=1 Tax=Mammaliicoccus sciuri TaxID=1296 RepID=UPI000D1E04C9|nr:DUF4355 domain-containing protein [Mammaliicoccus sciuri]PTJ71215.1 phage capsid protein [Mammaliicoccus sciuri]
MEKNKFKLNLQFFSDEEGKNENTNDNGSEEEQDQQEEVTFTPEQQKKVNEIIERRLAKEKKNVDKKVKDAVEEAKKLAKMNKDEKSQYELQKLQDELNALRNEKALNDMKATARSMFLDKDINVTDELLNLVVTSDAETTKQNVEAFSKILDSMVQSKVKEALRQDSPKNVGSTGLTRQEILEIKDDSERQNAIAQNIHLFN